ncbi:MAG: DUF6263 family protein [Luteibaculaceae bacterium]
MVQTIKKISFFFLGIALLSACDNAPKNDISLTLEVGKSYQQTMLTTSDINQQLFGQNMNTKMEVAGTLVYDVISESEDFFTIDVYYQALKMSMEVVQGRVDFDSEDENPESVFSRILASIKSKPFQIELLKTGKIKSITGIERLYNHIMESFPELSELDKQQAIAQIDQAFGPDVFQGNLEMVTVIYPEKPIAVGEKWTVKNNLAGTVAANIETEYLLKEIEGDNYILVGTSFMKTSDEDEPLSVDGLDLKYNLEGKITSLLKVDKNSGWLTKGEVLQDFSGTANIVEGPDFPGGMEIPMKIKTNISVAGNF